MLRAHTRVTVEGTVERGPFEDVARSYFETLWRGLVNAAPTPQEVASTVEFKYRPLDTPVAEVEIGAVRHPIISVTSFLAVSAPFNEDETEPSTVVIAAQVAHHKQADIEATVARMAGTLPEFVTVDMMVRAHTHTARASHEDEDWPLAPPKLDVDHPLDTDTEPIEVPTNSVGEIAAPARTAGERMAALLASHPDTHLFVSVLALTPAGLAWLDEQTQDMSATVLTEEWDEEEFRSAPDEQRSRILNFVARGNTSVFVRRVARRTQQPRGVLTPRAWIVEERLEDDDGFTFTGNVLAAFSGPTVLSGHWLNSEDDSLAPLDLEDVRRVNHARGRVTRRVRIADEQIEKAVQ